ncbi:uncharacterized protein K452DRAFT_237538 [Aplosporella prunicola CBS 121167]|uniref:Cytochrome P450 n=1 Tax=Aplosporella prunicola CBS 121167 TaxID=1176127 RepID=A0A6A6AZK2_9PEZI|nr:uncharacterized protein K452DRAFT_237538 [Aplosporella prunicola CBS 121167]KAF2136434.1 hypothetical protein K452DRAFT_237538 [Aplosporella prunicola CBS 121167]
MAYPWIKSLWLFLLGILTLFLWRIWAFTISPYLNPERPREAPYWIPFIGHSFSFFWNRDKTIEAGLNTFGRTHEPFALRIFCERMYIISSPADTVTIYRNSAAFSWDEYMNLLLQAFGITGRSLELAWHNPRPDAMGFKPNPLNPQNKNLIHLTEDFYKAQLLPGDKLDHLTSRYIDVIDHTFHWKNFSGKYVLEEGAAYKRISLKLFVRMVMTETVTRAMLGEIMFSFEPDLVNHLMVLHDYSWAVVFNLPKVLFPKLGPALGNLSKAIRSYLNTSELDREDECWAIRSILKSQEITGMDEDSRVAMFIMIWWAAHSNTVNACFWIFSYLLFNPGLLESIREETTPAFKDGRLDSSYLANECPLLDSVWSEVLRLVNGAMSVRKVVTSTKVSGKILESGNTVMIPFRQLHYNTNVWGSACFDFDPERFIREPKLQSHPSYRPFGGGISYCPGKSLAKSEVCGFVASLLQRFDISLFTRPGEPPQVFPKLDDTRPSTGTTGPMDDMDLVFDLVPRR